MVDTSDIGGVVDDVTADGTGRPISADEAAANLDTVLRDLDHVSRWLQRGDCQCGAGHVGEAVEALLQAIHVTAQTRLRLRTQYDDDIVDPPVKCW